MKKCIKCELEKDITLFYANKKAKDGKDGYCKECRSIIAKEYERNNKDKRVKYQKSYIERNKEKVNKRANEYYHKNKEKIRSKTNKEENITNAMKWREENAERYKAYQKAYRERKKAEKII